MRDFLLNEALKRLATEAATRFSTLVAGGDQIPFDVAADSEDDSAFYSYVPLTGRYVVERADELRALPSFGPAREAAVEAGVAAPYLEARGEQVPADPGERAELMLTSLHRLDSGRGAPDSPSTAARLDERPRRCSTPKPATPTTPTILIVPIVGLRMSLPRLQLPHGVRIVRADSIDAPIEAMRSEGMGRAAWEPQFLAVAEQHEERRRRRRPAASCSELISVMRTLQGRRHRPRPLRLRPDRRGHLAPDRHRRAGDPPRRLPPQRGRGRRAGRASRATLEARPDPDSALTWAVGRFEMGCERESALDGLSDHLLALRAVLEGHGPVGASLPMRAAALIADESLDRIEAREKVEEVLELERALMNGRLAGRRVELAGWTEEGVRRLLLQAALGELGNDLITTADETLIATGLDGGDAEIAVDR